MEKLEPYFRRESEGIIDRISQGHDLGETVRRVTEEVNGLLGKDGSFYDNISVRDQRIINWYFNAVLSAVSLLGKVDLKVSVPSFETASGEREGAEYVKVGAGIVGASAAAAVVPGVVIIPLVAGLLVGTASALLSNRVIDHPEKTPQSGDVRKSVEGVVVTANVNPEAVGACLRMAVENFDQLMEEVSDIQKEALAANLRRPFKLEEAPSVMAFFHEMLEFETVLRGKEDELPAEIKELCNYLPIMRRILRTYGIDVVEYADGMDMYWFDVSEDASVQAGGNQTIRPALIKDGVPLLRGIIAATASK